MNEKWLQWAIELQSIGQTGLSYVKDVYDKERYERIREIAAEMIEYKTEIPIEKIKTLFCNEIGYQTPKIDTRAAIFNDDKILLVQEKDGRWSLPGGWCEVNLSIKENTIKEVKEEAGLDVIPKRVIAIHDKKKHNIQQYPYGVCKIFILCIATGGSFQKNSETLQSKYYSIDKLPALSEEKNSREQIELCFKAYRDQNWQVEFD